MKHFIAFSIVLYYLHKESLKYAIRTRLIQSFRVLQGNMPRFYGVVLIYNTHSVVLNAVFAREREYRQAFYPLSITFAVSFLLLCFPLKLPFPFICFSIILLFLVYLRFPFVFVLVLCFSVCMFVFC